MTTCLLEILYLVAAIKRDVLWKVVGWDERDTRVVDVNRFSLSFNLMAITMYLLPGEQLLDAMGSFFEL